jgi:predicted ATPase/DNA-binding CsgD family transcriptional regulator
VPVGGGDVTPRERAVLDLLGEQLTHEQIGRRLFISPRTVETHVASLRRKLELPDHRALVRFAVAQRSQPTPPPALATPLTSFVGRRAELDELADALGSARLVSVVGPGGAGKTRLALAAAERVERAHGVRYVDLIPVTDAAGVVDATARACGAVPSSRLGPVDALIATLHPLQVLLVLDNCEHQVNAVAVLVEQLADACPRLTVLVTTRVRLAVPFERVVRIGGLSAGDDVDLFVERAVAAGGVPAAGERDRIAAVCRTLDGLPLALELAAVRLPSLGIDGVERGLLDQAELLRSGPRATPRQRSMHEALDWSAGLLTAPARSVLARLSVLAASFDAAAAVEVAGFGAFVADDVPPALVELVEHSLLTATAQPDGRLTYRFLEPVRQYGQSRMTAVERPAFQRHLEWCLVMITVAATPLPQLADDVRAALAWATATNPVPAQAHALGRAFGLLLFRSGLLREAQQRLGDAADLASDPTAAAMALADAAAVAKCRVRGTEALRLEVGAAERAAAGDAGRLAALALARAAELLTRFAGMFADPDENLADELLVRAAAAAPHDRQAAAAIAVARAGRRTDAADHGRAALAAARGIGDVLLESAALDAVIGATMQRGDVLAANRLAGERLARLGTRADDPATGLELKDALHVGVFCALGAGDLRVARKLGERQRALPFLGEQRDISDEELLAPAVLAGDWPAAERTSEQFLAEWITAGRPCAPGRGLGPAAVALMYGLRGEPDERDRWLGVLAGIKGVPKAQAGVGTGYGELFEALVLLHRAQPSDALALLGQRPADLYAGVFGQWWDAVEAEAATLAHAPQAPDLLDRARTRCAGNPVAAAIARRAQALHEDNSVALFAIAAEFAAVDADYQRTRTLALAAAMEHKRPVPRR